MYGISKHLLLLTAVLVIGFLVTIAPPKAHASEPLLGTSISIPSANIYSEIYPMYIIQRAEKLVWNITPWETRVGHLESTAWLGEGGNIALGAHSTMPDGSPGPFALLTTVQIGDEITITEAGKTFIFIVERVLLVRYDEVSIVIAQENLLTLITCGGLYDETIGDYRARLVVIAKQ